MEKTANLDDNFSDDFQGINEEHPKLNKKKILILSITISVAIALITTIFLVGYFKFNWFKDQYDLDIKIKNFANQADYFSEKRIIKSKVLYTSGDSDEREQIIDTNFVVILTDRKKINITKGGESHINNATLIILDSKIKIGEKQTNLNSFNIFDEKQLTEFESNPSGSVYPMAQFSYYENGTIIDINLPEDMDRYNAQSMAELINNVIPKLSRKKKEDRKHGLSVKRKRTEKGDILIETQEPKEYSDKFTRSKYKGSKYSKNTEIDIENEKVKKVSTTTNLFLQTQKNDEQTLDFGLQDFTYEIISEIVSTKNEEERKEEVQLVKRLSKKLKFVKNDDLIESLLLKEQEKEKEENGENKDLEENQKNNEDLDNSKQLRNLEFEGSFSYKWNLVAANILGQDILIEYEIGLEDGSLKNILTLSCGKLKMKLGNSGTSSNKKENKDTGDKKLFTVPFPGTPIPVSFSFKVSGNIGYGVDIDIPSRKFTISLSGKLVAKAELGAGVEGVAEIAVGAEGTLISVKASNTITKTSDSFFNQGKIHISGGEIKCYVYGKLISFKVFNLSKTFLKGWSKVIE